METEKGNPDEEATIVLLLKQEAGVKFFWDQAMLQSFHLY